MTDFDNPLYQLRRIQCRMTIAQAADFLAVHPSTIRRQESGKVPINPLFLRLLAIRAGHLGEIHPRWHGWQIDRDGEMFNPLGYKRGFVPGDLNALLFRAAQVRAMELKIKRLERRIFLLAPANDGFYLAKHEPPGRSDDL
ncbi:hypothetical protein A11A3_10336 [Alcanivorax hongdengensis A-11-3]|uniref:Uncharacterized protein n=1 Tax=Alcanivorax hongdengensis A-11-3 TaxID=1177179 RepID=L0WAM3_9GAMM|nr:DUF3653 domain-containing protein [Alcanivorax hongdengensis]EKF74049.1 hypothetical protein A11A3_10336 [Alcanivorax hongdengensis A-11-3]